MQTHARAPFGVFLLLVADAFTRYGHAAANDNLYEFQVLCSFYNLAQHIPSEIHESKQFDTDLAVIKTIYLANAPLEWYNSIGVKKDDRANSHRKLEGSSSDEPESFRGVDWAAVKERLEKDPPLKIAREDDPRTAEYRERKLGILLRKALSLVGKKTEREETNETGIREKLNEALYGKKDGVFDVSLLGTHTNDGRGKFCKHDGGAVQALFGTLLCLCGQGMDQSKTTQAGGTECGATTVTWIGNGETSFKTKGTETTAAVKTLGQECAKLDTGEKISSAAIGRAIENLKLLLQGMKLGTSTERKKLVLGVTHGTFDPGTDPCCGSKAGTNEGICVDFGGIKTLDKLTESVPWIKKMKETAEAIDQYSVAQHRIEDIYKNMETLRTAAELIAVETIGGSSKLQSADHTGSTDLRDGIQGGKLPIKAEEVVSKSLPIPKTAGLILLAGFVTE